MAKQNCAAFCHHPNILKKIRRNRSASKFLIHTVYSPHLIIGKLEIKNFSICGDSFFLCRFWYYRNVFLDGPAKADLGNAFSVIYCDFHQFGPVQICASCQRRIGLHGDAFGLTVGNQFRLIPKGMDFNLIYGGDSIRMGKKIFQLIDAKIADAMERINPSL